MFGIGTWELVVILILALIILGPDKLPDVARSVGKSLTKLRQTADEVKREIDLDGLKQEITSELLEDPEIEELQRNLDLRGDIRRAMRSLQEPPPLPGPADVPAAGQPAAEPPPAEPLAELGPARKSRTDIEEPGPEDDGSGGNLAG